MQEMKRKGNDRSINFIQIQSLPGTGHTKSRRILFDHAMTSYRDH